MSKLAPHRWPAEEWHLVADEKGRPLGKYKSPSPLLKNQMIVVKEFLTSIQKGRVMSDTPKQEKTNIVWLAGALKFDPKVGENQTRALIDVGMKSAVQVAIYTGNEAPQGNMALADKLKRFKGGDFIKVVAMLRPYGVKQDDNSFKNSISVDITEIKNDPPPRRQPEQRRMSDDDVPF